MMELRYVCIMRVVCSIFFFQDAESTIELTTPVSVSVKEKEGRRLALTPDTDPIICRDTTDGDLIRADIGTVTPANPCFGCFAMEPCGANREENFCLVYQPSAGELSFNQAPSYVITVMCTDDLEPAVFRNMEVLVIKNLPPEFDPPVLFETDSFDFTKSKQRAADIYQVKTTDNENDTVYYSMYTTPSYAADFFHIGENSGRIKASQHLQTLCLTIVSFHVTIWDSYHAPVGPKAIQITFDRTNDVPKINNVGHTIEIPENTAVDNTIIVVDVTDTESYPEVSLIMTSEPERGLDLYRIISGTRVRVRRPLDYEYEPLREVTLTITAFDGVCYSESYVIRVVITDVNEPFYLQPIFFEPTAYEGFIKVIPDLIVVDQDEKDSHTFTKKSGSGNLQVEGTTGVVTNKLIVDIDPRDRKNLPIVVEVEDEDGNTDRFQVNITVMDINDNAPQFIKAKFEYTVDNCTDVGEIVGKVFAKDDDSALNGNNLLVFSGSGSSSFAVLADGNVLYTSLLAVGDVDAGSAYVTDLGLNPEPLKGTPVVITVECKICEVTPPVTTTPTTTTTEWTGPRSAEASEILRATDRSTNDRSWISTNIAWICASGALLAALVILAVFVGLVTCKCCRGPGKPKASKPQQNGHQKGIVNDAQKAPQQHSNELNAEDQLQQQQHQQHQHQQLQHQQQQQQQGLTGRSEISDIDYESAGLPMYPPPLQYPQVFSENDQPHQRKTKPPKVKARKRSKDHKRAEKDKEKTKKDEVQRSQKTKDKTKEKPPKERHRPNDVKQPAESDAKNEDELKQRHKPNGVKQPAKSDGKNDDELKQRHNPNDAKQSPEPEAQNQNAIKQRHRPIDVKRPAEPDVKNLNEMSRKPQMQVGEYFDLDVITPRGSPLPTIE